MLSHLRDAFRSGDIWLTGSRRYGDIKDALVPITAARTTAKLVVPFDPVEWIVDRKSRMARALERLTKAAKTGAISGGSILDGVLKTERLVAAVPAEADELVLELYRRMPDVRITDIMLEVDAATGFTDAFTHLRTGSPCKDRIGLLNVLLAEGINLGLSKMAEASNTQDYFQLSRLSRWHVESVAITRALATVIEGQEQYADTGDFTDHVFAVTALLGYRFHSPHPRPAIHPALRLRSRRCTKGFETADGRKDQGECDHDQLARYSSLRRNHGRRDHATQPTPEKIRRLSTPA